jgi:UDP-N-acetylmuramoyl-tripeptide--D-alanyl-D-alanine ligase
MKASLDNFRGQEHPRKVLIIGDMLELGEEEEEAHRKLLQSISGSGFEAVFLVGTVFSSLPLEGEGRAFGSTDDLASWLERNPLKDCLILLKASRGIGLEKLLDRL